MRTSAEPTGTVVVTGANRGIGYAVAAQVLQAGCEVVLVCRDRTAGQAACVQLGGPARLVVGDLSTVRSVRAAAAALGDACSRIDALVHNAGVWPARRVLTEDGLEQSFVTNHLAPFLLNHELEPLLLASGARVVQVSAGLYVNGRADPDRTPTGRDFHWMRTYADTKLCNLMMVPLFAARWAGTGVTINAVHPGVVRTGLGDRRGPTGLLLKMVKRKWDDPANGAGPVARLAVADLAGVSGRYFHLDIEQAMAPVATDEELAQRLWDQAAELTGAARQPPAAAGS